MAGKFMTLTVNGARREVAGEPERSLLTVLRDELDLIGAKYGCGEGQCGSCTVLVGDQAVRACLVRVGALDGMSIRTIEGLEDDEGNLHPLQQAFLDQGASQCGYCTPGMILGGVALLEKDPDPSEEAIARALQGNLCRCGAHPRIVAAIRQAVKSGRGGGR